LQKPVDSHQLQHTSISTIWVLTPTQKLYHTTNSDTLFTTDALKAIAIHMLVKGSDIRTCQAELFWSTGAFTATWHLWCKQ